MSDDQIDKVLRIMGSRLDDQTKGAILVLAAHRSIMGIDDKLFGPDFQRRAWDVVKDHAYGNCPPEAFE